jgi:hypothetical protein
MRDNFDLGYYMLKILKPKKERALTFESCLGA